MKDKNGRAVRDADGNPRHDATDLHNIKLAREHHDARKQGRPKQHWRFHSVTRPDGTVQQWWESYKVKEAA